MALKVGQAFQRTSPNPIDESLLLTKAQMLAVNDNLMPSKYFAICEDDGKLYLYDKQATPSAETGKYTLYGGGGSYDDTALTARVAANETAITNMYTKAEVDQEIDDKLANFDHLDYKVADSVPTATEVVIEGATVPVVEGTRYLVPVTGEDRFKEYVVLNGNVYDLGSATGTGSSALETALTVTNPIGKYAKDEEIPAATPLETVLRGILGQTYYPTLTPPSVQIGFNAPALAKVGQSIPSATATLTFNRGSIDPQYTAESEFRAGEASDYVVTLTGADVTYSDNNATGSFTVPTFTKNSKGMVELQATVTHGAGVQPKDSDGQNYGEPLAAGTVTAKKQTEFILPIVYGVSASATISDFTGLTEVLQKKQASKEISYDTNNQHMVFAYDSSYGELSEVYDPNSFPCIGGFDSSVLTVDGQQYRVYVAKSATTDTGAKYTFKF